MILAMICWLIINYTCIYIYIGLLIHILSWDSYVVISSHIFDVYIGCLFITIYGTGILMLAIICIHIYIYIYITPLSKPMFCIVFGRLFKAALRMCMQVYYIMTENYPLVIWNDQPDVSPCYLKWWCSPWFSSSPCQPGYRSPQIPYST